MDGSILATRNITLHTYIHSLELILYILKLLFLVGEGGVDSDEGMVASFPAYLDQSLVGCPRPSDNPSWRASVCTR